MRKENNNNNSKTFFHHLINGLDIKKAVSKLNQQDETFVEFELTNSLDSIEIELNFTNAKERNKSD